MLGICTLPTTVVIKHTWNKGNLDVNRVRASKNQDVKKNKFIVKLWYLKYGCLTLFAISYLNWWSHLAMNVN